MTVIEELFYSFGTVIVLQSVSLRMNSQQQIMNYCFLFS